MSTERKTFQKIAQQLGKTAAMQAAAALTAPTAAPEPEQKDPELPAPKLCPFCGKPPMTMWRTGVLVPFVYCLTVGCVTYGKPELAMRLDVWNSRVIQIDEQTMKLAQIGDALLRYSQTDIRDNDRIKDLLSEARSSPRLRGRDDATEYQRNAARAIQRAQSHEYHDAAAMAAKLWKGINRADL